jgi:outer membrane protein TolC
MITRHTRWLACGVAVVLLPAASIAQTGPAAGERLSLERAIQIALDNNRQLRTAALDAQQADEQLAIVRTRRLPAFQLEATASQLLMPVDFSFPVGAFGEFPGTGPIPATDTNVSVPRQPIAYVVAEVSQPLSRLFRLGLDVGSAELTCEIGRERVRAQRLAVITDVKRLYFAILQTRSALSATDDAVALYRELDRTLQVRVAQKVALRSDSLDVQFRLAQEELLRTSSQNTLASQKEQLNQLLGRDVATAFDVDDASEMAMPEIDLAAARARAIADRPDLRQAQLLVKQADLERRATKADRIPEISVAVSYSSNFNMDVVPMNLATAGVALKWEPFDWGRRDRQLAVRTQAVEQARLRLRDAEDRALIEVNAQFRALGEARARLNVAQMAQSSAREKLRVRNNQFQVQAALLTDVLQIRSEVAETADRYQQALAAFWTARANFEQAVGEEGLR